MILHLFAREPELGVGKTRLAKDIGPARAHFYSQVFMTYLGTRLAKLNHPLWVHYTGTKEPTFLKQAFTTAAFFHPQVEGSLGERLAHASKMTAQSAHALLGTDSPDLPLTYFKTAHQGSVQKEATLIPTEDGGYCLLALPWHVPEVFRDIAWSTPIVFEQTLNALKKVRIPTNIAPTWYDIDHETELERFLKKHPFLRNA